MKIIKPSVPAGNHTSGGYVGAPQSFDWRKEWIANKVQWVKLSCGHIDDIKSNGMLIINSFEGCTVDCYRCDKLVSVIETLKTKETVVQPELPPF